MAEHTPEMIAQGLRLQAARIAAGYKSARAAARGNGWPYSSYYAHESGGRTIGPDDAERYVRKFRAKGVRTTAAQILFGERDAATTAQAQIIEVPLLSWVSAGRLAGSENQIDVSEVPKLSFADLGPGEFFALKVHGDSMNLVSPDGSTIIVNRANRRLEAGKAYVFAVRGEATYKLWRPEPPSLFPYSTNPANEPIFLQRKRDWEVVGRVRRTVLDL